MSATRSFEVRLMVGRTLTRTIVAFSEHDAEVIAQYLFDHIGLHTFCSDEEEIIDVVVLTDDAEGVQ